MNNSNQLSLKKAVDAVFDSYDKDKNGTLDIGEVTALINDAFAYMDQSKKSKKISQQDVIKFVDSVDSNNDKKISKEQLLEIFKKVSNMK